MKKCDIKSINNYVVDLKSFADSLHIDSSGAPRDVCKRINDFFAELKRDDVASTVQFESIVKGTQPHYPLASDLRSYIDAKYTFLQKPLKVASMNSLGIQKIGSIAEKDGVKLVQIFWEGYGNSTEPLEEIKKLLETTEQIEFLKDIEKKEKQYVTQPSSPLVEQKKPARKVQFEHKTYEPIDLPVISNVVPSQAQLLEQGKALLPKKLKAVTEYVSQWWGKNYKKELDKLVYVENPGCGDCMYYAVAPALKILKPELFVGVADSLDAMMLHLRRLMATLIPEDEEGLKTYVKLYADHFPTVRQKNDYLKTFQLLPTESVEEFRLRIQNDMMRSEHFAHLPDFSLLRQLVGNTIGFIIIGGAYNEKPEQFIIHPAGVAVEQLTDPNVLYMFILNQQVHFTRLQAQDGRFVFSRKEMQQEFPGLWDGLARLVAPSPVSQQLANLQNDIYNKYPALIRLQTETVGGQKRDVSYQLIFHELLKIPKNKDVNKELLSRNSKLASYDKLSANEKNLVLLQTLVGSTANLVDSLERMGEAKVRNFVADKTEQLQAKAAKTTAVGVAGAKTSTGAATIATPLPVIKQERPKAPKKSILKQAKTLLLCAPLSEAEEGMVSKIWANVEKSAKTKEWKRDRRNNELTTATLLLLRDENELNDEVVNAFIVKMITEQTNKNRIDSFDTFFYASLLMNKTPQQIARLQTILQSSNIFELDKILVPIHVIDRHHWILAVISMHDHTIDFYDSLCGTNIDNVYKNLTNYLNIKATELQQQPVQWEKIVYQEVPQQTNKYDCGAFVLAYMKQILDPLFNGDFTFSQKDISCFRKRILLELMEDTFMQTEIPAKALLSKQPRAPPVMDLQTTQEAEEEEKEEDTADVAMLMQTPSPRKNTEEKARSFKYVD